MIPHFKNWLTEGFLDGWNINGVGSYYMGTPLAISCSYQNAPLGYYTGTPTTQGFSLRCEQTGPLFLPPGSNNTTTGASVTAAAYDPHLWYAFNTNSFSMPAPSSLGIGNEQPILTYGPGFENLDLSIFKQFRLGRETRNLEFRAEAYNSFNHFNPGNPSTSIQWNYLTGAITSSNTGLITGQNGSPRVMDLSLRLRF